MEIVDIGKSRFCEEWLDCITNEPHILIRFHCSPHNSWRAFVLVQSTAQLCLNRFL
jgi:hypothetical protein